MAAVALLIIVGDLVAAYTRLPQILRWLVLWVIPSYFFVELGWIAVLVLGLVTFQGQGGYLIHMIAAQMSPYYQLSIALVACIGFLL